MLFSSLIFLFSFLPVSLLAYYLSPRKFRNGILLLLSLIFYAWGGIEYTLILIVSILVNYFLVSRIDRDDANKKTWLTIGLIFNIGVIVFYKYLDFFIENINALSELFSSDSNPIPLQHIVLPLGISFFTFQQMSMLWDVYRDPNSHRSSLTNTALYIGLFPQLIAGPIVRYHDIIDQIKHRSETISLFRSGVIRFVLGLFKKIILANTCGQLADSIMDASVDSLSTPVAWLGIIAYAFQIYFDFSGYSDMAIGLGRMFGFRILENFNFPYIARSMKDFWQRWHISLSTWFRDYVYIPLGGNRVSASRTYYNLLIVFILTGFWHGATWSFVVWGLFHGAFLVIEKLGFGKILNKLPAIFSWSYTMLVVLLGWVFFRIEELPDAWAYIEKLFGYKSNHENNILGYLNNEILIILDLALASSLGVLQRIRKFVSGTLSKVPAVHQLGIDVFTLVLFFVSAVYIISDSYNPFIYFRF